MTVEERWRPPATILGWGGRPSNHGPCRRCGEHVAWAIDVSRRTVLLQRDPDRAGTVMIRKNGTHMADLEDRSQFSEEEAAAIKARGYPLFVRHARVCGAPAVQANKDPVHIGEVLPPETHPG